MLSGMRKSVQTELDEFFAHLKEQAQIMHHVSEQALAKVRAKLSTTAIPALNYWLVARADADGFVPRWRGRRLGSPMPRPCVSGAAPATSRAPPVPTKSPLAFTCQAPR